MKKVQGLLKQFISPPPPILSASKHVGRELCSHFVCKLIILMVFTAKILPKH